LTLPALAAASTVAQNQEVTPKATGKFDVGAPFDVPEHVDPALTHGAYALAFAEEAPWRKSGVNDWEPDKLRQSNTAPGPA
jgi:hypothetical protein